MSDSGSANSWTILTPEETAAETLTPLAEGTEHQEDTAPAEHAESPLEEADVPVSDPGSAAETLLEEGDAPVASAPTMEDHQVAETTTGPEEDTGPDAAPDAAPDADLTPSSVSDLPPPSSSEVPAPSLPDSDPHSHSEGLPEGPDLSSADPDSFSDSYTHISPSPEEPPASLPTTETLGRVDLTQEEEGLLQEETPSSLNGEGLGQGEEEPELSQMMTDLGKQAVYLVDQLVMDLFHIWARKLSAQAVAESAPDTAPSLQSQAPDSPVDSKEVVVEPVVARRRSSLLAALERVGRTEEKEEPEEEFHLPQREEESGFSVNKCILGAIILVGLGTIFFSEGDFGTRELRDAEVPVKKELLKPDLPSHSAAVDSAELLNKIAKGSQQIAVLQAQLQAQKAELKVATGQAAEGAKERLRREEVEKENGRLKKEMASLPVLQKENERMKRELESVPVLQRELKSLRATVTELTFSPANEAAPPPVTPAAPPPSGQAGDSSQDATETTDTQTKEPLEGETIEVRRVWKKEKHDTGENQRKEMGKPEWKEKEKDRKKGKYEHGGEGKEWKQKEEKKKDWKEGGEWKKEKASRGDEGKPWKDRDGKKEQKEKSERKEWKEDKEWKKGKHEKWDHKEKRGGKEHGEGHKDEWKGEKEWRKGKGGHKESDKGWKEKKEWKEKGEKKEWKKEGEKKKDYKHKEKLYKYEKHQKDLWQSPGHKHPHTHQPSPGQPEYWLRQRERLNHKKPSPSSRCDSVETCAQAEGLHPVAFPEFEAILQVYLAKAEGAGVEAPRREELSKLANEFFSNGVFVHDQLKFRDFVEDVGDILEDMVEGDDEEEEEEEEDSAIENEMEEFENEVLAKFSVPVAGEREERKKGEWKKEKGRGRG